MRKSRFPELKKVDGKIVCRCGCGKPIPKGRQTWASRECVKRFHPFEVRQAVRARDKGVCQICKLDIPAAYQKWRSERPSWQRDWALKGQGPREEYDHIVPFSEGGLTVLENMRTLCHDCHVVVTTKWRREKIKTAALPPASHSPCQTHSQKDD